MLLLGPFWQVVSSTNQRPSWWTTAKTMPYELEPPNPKVALTWAAALLCDRSAV
jgi:hypothetical protein